MKKINLVAIAVSAALTSGFVAAESKGTDILTDGWEIHGYLSSNYRLIDGETVDNEFGKPDYKTAGTMGKSTNQVELTVKKNTTFQNGVYSNFNLRTEYGNGNTWAYSSSGSQKQENNDADFEVKEAFIEIGGLPYLGQDTSIWAGQRFLNRAAGLLSGEFWKQSSGVGAGIQTKLAGTTAGFALVSADTDSDIQNEVSTGTRNTLTSFDFYLYGVDVGFGSLDFDAKYIRQANQDSELEDGFGASITLNSSYYGLNGWTQTAIAYGNGTGHNRGVNFGSWSGASGENEESLFFTSYGVWNITNNLQMGSEITYFRALDELFGADDLERLLVAARPSYKVNDNLRLEATVSYGYETGEEGYWGRTGDAVDSDIFNIELATAFTVNADYFGRPQIKPYISYVVADDAASAELIGINDGGRDEIIAGIHAELWF